MLEPSFEFCTLLLDGNGPSPGPVAVFWAESQTSSDPSSESVAVPVTAPRRGRPGTGLLRPDRRTGPGRRCCTVTARRRQYRRAGGLEAALAGDDRGSDPFLPILGALNSYLPGEAALDDALGGQLRDCGAHPDHFPAGATSKTAVKVPSKKTNNQASFGGSLLKNNMEGAQLRRSQPAFIIVM